MDTKDVAKKLAKIMTLHCCRNTFIEELHEGTMPASKTGDFSDVKVVTPYGAIPWKELSRISDEEMKRLNKEIVNKIYTFLDQLVSKGTLPMHPVYLNEPTDWDEPEIDLDLKFIFDKLKKRMVRGIKYVPFWNILPRMENFVGLILFAPSNTFSQFSLRNR